jgi:hypothetical protein
MNLGELLLTLESIDETVRSVNLEILKLKQDLKEYQKKKQEQQAALILEINNLGKLQKRQDENTKKMAELLINKNIMINK